MWRWRSGRKTVCDRIDLALSTEGPLLAGCGRWRWQEQRPLPLLSQPTRKRAAVLRRMLQPARLLRQRQRRLQRTRGPGLGEINKSDRRSHFRLDQQQGFEFALAAHRADQRAQGQRQHQIGLHDRRDGSTRLGKGLIDQTAVLHLRRHQAQRQLRGVNPANHCRGYDRWRSRSSRATRECFSRHNQPL